MKYGHAIAEAFADRHPARLEVAVSEIDEHRLMLARVEDRVGRNGELWTAGDSELDVHEHFWLHAHAGIRRVESDFERARDGVHLRLDVAHLGHDRGRIAIRELHVRLVADLDGARIRLEHVRNDPHTVEIRYGVQVAVGRDLLIRKRV